MGCFDTVNIRCPHCSAMQEIQTKSGPCNLEYYPAVAVPVDVACGVLGPETCRNCHKPFAVHARTPRIELYAVPLEYKVEENG